MATRKQNKGGSNSLLTLGLLAVGGYFAYEWFFATPATAAPSSTPASGSTPPATATGATAASDVVVGGFDLSQVPWYVWLGGAAVLAFAFGGNR